MFNGSVRTSWSVFKHFNSCKRLYATEATALRSRKAKGKGVATHHFVDCKNVKVVAGCGGDGCISFLQLWSNEKAGPDGGDGGNGGHVIFQASNSVRDLIHISPIIMGELGEKGYSKDCHGKSARHTIINVPVGTIVKQKSGKVIADLDEEGIMFIAARGGTGGKGNHFFITDTFQAPEIAEFGAKGEELQYVLEVRSIAHIGLIGFPNAGKSTLLQAISRARPKVAPYPFTTLHPYIGMVAYDDYKQISVADLPGLIPGSHLNKGLGIEFLRHAERCMVLMFVVDLSVPEPWSQVDNLRYELSQFSKELADRPQIIVGNKIDLPEAQENMKFENEFDLPVIPISAKMGNNLSTLLNKMKLYYEELISTDKTSDSEE